MNHLIVNVGYFLELWMIQLYAGLVWEQKICFKGFSYILFMVNGIILTGINLDIIPDFFVLTTYIMLFGFLKKKDKGSWKDNFAKFCITMVFAAGTEIVAGVVVALVEEYLSEVCGFLAVNGIALAVALLVTYLLQKRGRTIETDIKYRTIFKTILICFIPICILVVLYHLNHEIRIWYTILLVLFIFTVFWYLEKVQKTEYRMRQKELELKVNRIYGGLYENVITDIRRKQHEFNNQLAAIYSSHEVAGSLDELVKLQKDYCNHIEDEGEYDLILMTCNEPLLAGFIYYKCLYCKEHQVRVCYEVNIEHYSGRMLSYEIIEILGVLIDNALEKELENEYQDKFIELCVTEKENAIHIRVSNRVADWSNVQPAKMFQTGFSTKGKDRGLGLSRAQQICEKYGTKIQVLVEESVKEKITFHVDIF